MSRVAATTDWETWIGAMAPQLGLPIDPAWRPEVGRFLALAAGMAAVLETVDLGDDHLDLDAVLTLPEVAR